ncbi:MAG: DUF4139 domain-containing protein [Deltaproteobacteria bacterium]|nr:DUF4139 domain-containing protein [Deltaproteobacteria bacterium]
MNQRWGIGLLLLVGASACGGGPAVLGSDEVPVRRVVLYRNGVAYFERSGQVEGDSLEFGVRQSDVGDFLTSLTVVERTAGGGVSSVSFEVPEPPEVEEADTDPGRPEILAVYQGGAVIAPPPPRPSAEPAEEDDERVDVTLRLQGDEEHDLMIAYVVGSPIWRPSYRVVIDEDEALLQAWAVVQNTSGEDWTDVELSLTTGTPIAFRSDLGTPITPPRPTITDTGEVVMAVPMSETTLAQAPPPPPAQAMAEEMEPMEDSAGYAMGGEQGPMDGAGSGSGRARPRRSRRAEGRRGVPPARSPSPVTGMIQESGDADNRYDRGGISANMAQQSVSAMAASAVLGDGVTRYDLNEPVTIPDGASTMVAILSERVPGREAHLFAPDPGVPTSRTHPFRVVRLQNETGAVLERGPISVLGHGSFLGQGVLEPLPRNATTFVPFALDRSVAVRSTTRGTEADAALVRVTNTQVIVERFSERRTTYTVQNGGEDEVEVFLRHRRMSVERTPVRRVVQFMSEIAAEAIGVYLAGAAVDAAAGPALTRALEIRTTLTEARATRATAQRQKMTLTAQADETRRNIESIRRLPNTADLRSRLVQRLSDLDRQVADLTRQVVEADTTISEQTVRLSEALQDVTLVVAE